MHLKSIDSAILIWILMPPFDTDKSGLPQNFRDKIPWLFQDCVEVFPILVKIPWLFQKFQKISKFQKFHDFSMTVATL